MAKYRIFDGREYTIATDNAGIFKDMGYTPIDEADDNESISEYDDNDAPDYEQEDIESICEYYLDH